MTLTSRAQLRKLKTPVKICFHIPSTPRYYHHYYFHLTAVFQVIWMMQPAGSRGSRPSPPVPEENLSGLMEPDSFMGGLFFLQPNHLHENNEESTKH